MTISKFERGETVPRDPAVLQALSSAAEAVNLKAEAAQFAAACKEALNIDAVNRMYPSPRSPAGQGGLTIAFQTLPEWRLLMIALFSVRYDPEAALAIDAAGGPVREIVDQVLQQADISRGIGPELFRELEARIRTLMDERALRRIPKTVPDQESRQC
jgi:hypothetical protein